MSAGLRWGRGVCTTGLWHGRRGWAAVPQRQGLHSYVRDKAWYVLCANTYLGARYALLLHWPVRDDVPKYGFLRPSSVVMPPRGLWQWQAQLATHEEDNAARPQPHGHKYSEDGEESDEEAEGYGVARTELPIALPIAWAARGRACGHCTLGGG